MKIKRFLKLGMVAAVLILTAFTAIPPASAARMTISRQLCDLAVFPFNSSGTPLYENALLPFIKYVNSTVCKAHLTIPTNTPFTAQSYNPQPVVETADIKILPNAENKHGPIAQHEHNYYNDSLEDNFYYESFVAKFAIDFAPDTKVNINNVTCITPYPSWWQRYDQNGNDKLDPIKDCQGTVSDLWGGTSVTKNTNGVIWSFGTNNNGANMPKIFGKNPTLDPLIGGGFNSSIDANREFGANVNLTTPGPANSNDKLWSATTSSRILVRDFSIKKTDDMTKLSRFCTTAGDYDYGWCSLPSLAGYEVATPFGSKPFYWFPIGTTSTVWEKSASDEQTTCAALNWEIKQNGQVVQPANVVADTPMTIKVTPTFNPSNKTVPLKYKWSAGTWTFWIFNPKGQFKDNTASDPDAGNPWAYDDDTTVYYTGGSKGTTVYVDAYYVSDGKKADPCKKEFPITKETPPEAQCTAINLTPNFVNAPGSTPYTATVTFSDGKSYNTTVNWSGVNGTFTKPANETNMSGANPNLYQYTNTYNTAATTDSVTAKVTSVQGAKNSAICQTGMTVKQKPENPKCVSVNLSPNSLNAPGSTPLTATVTYSDGQSYNTELTWSQTNGNFSSAAVQIHQSSQAFTNTYSTNNTSGSVTARVTDILDQNVENSPACQNGQSISQGQGNPYCVDLILTPNQLNATGSTNMSATAVFSDGNTYDTTVLWTGSNGNYSSSTTQTKDSGTAFSNTFTIANEQNPASASVRVIDVPDPNADNGPGCLAAKSIYTPPDKDRCRDINVFRYHNQYCVEVTAGEYDGKFTWVFNGVNQTPTVSCVTIPPGTNWRVYATDEPKNKDCQAEGKIAKRPPSVSKGVRSTYRAGSYVNVITIPSNQTEIDYRITFNADSSSKTTATIIDDISDGSIKGETRPVDNGEGGYINYVPGSQSVDRPRCSNFITENCYTGDIGNGGITLVKVTGQVTILYKGVVNDSAITPEVCVEGEICQEKYTNSASVEYWIYDDDDEDVIDQGRLTSNETLVQIFCQYILTRAAGDIYLESDLNAGVDIRMCSKYTSTTGILVVPGEPTPPVLGKTGLPSEIMMLSHEICTAGQSGSIPEALKPFYGQTVVQNLSSQICEVKLQPGTAWQQKTITNDINENKTRISRWEADYSNMGVNMSSVLLDAQYNDKKVYHIKNGNLTVDQLYTLSDGEGAKTFIVENGDLYIRNNITYGTCLPRSQPCTVNDVASLAFIVLNGSVYVNPSVTEMSGVYFVQEGERTDSGRLYSLDNEPSYDKLVIYGSVYGDIEPLFLNRLFAGDPSLEEAGIVVRFDQRIILNTPTGLRDIMSYSATQVAR